MKKLFTLFAIALLAVTFSGCQTTTPQVSHAPKRLLVVTTTTGFRHSSIPTAERIISQLAHSSGEFTVDFVEQPPDKPRDLPHDASDDDKAAHKIAEDQWNDSLKAALQK